MGYIGGSGWIVSFPSPKAGIELAHLIQMPLSEEGMDAEQETNHTHISTVQTITLQNIRKVSIQSLSPVLGTDFKSIIMQCNFNVILQYRSYILNIL